MAKLAKCPSRPKSVITKTELTREATQAELLKELNQRERDTEERILDAGRAAGQKVYLEALEEGIAHETAMHRWVAALDLVALAAEATAAKAAGYETWSALQAAEAERELAL